MSTPFKTTTIPPFVLTSPLGTDIWRKPPNIEVFNAPTHPTPLPKHPLHSLQQARLSLTFPATTTLRQFDQAGLILHFTDRNSEKYKWIKTGIEFYEGKAWVSTVGCDAWSDWSVVPLPFADRPSATIDVVKKGMSLWVYWIIENDGLEERIPLRELNWVFAEEDWDVGVGAFVARETKGEGKDELTVEFNQGIKIETLEKGH